MHHAEALNRDDLAAQMRAGLKPRFLFFWGHQAPAGGGIGANCLSQWFSSPFQLDGVAYPTAEHGMMAGKAALFGDQASLAAIRAARNPAKAKALGRAVEGFDEARWTAARFDLVVRCNLAKFSQDAALGAYLLGTGTRILVEASPLDRVWGIGLAADHVHASQPERWPGLNLLGFALMAVRAQLRASAPPPP